ncbi:MAG: arsenite methyltransferase [Nitrosopumilus sp.]|nr:arsenite methyltransferase [Nitrosopumilus sp.]
MNNNDGNIKEKIKGRYGKMAVFGNSGSCCMPSECCSGEENTGPSAIQSIEAIGYNPTELASIPHQSSILGVGCGNPTKFAHIKEGDIVVDLGSGAGIDVFLAANVVKGSGKVIGVDMTDKMLEKARHNAKKYSYKNVEFRQGGIEKRIPVEDNFADVAISDCVINLTSDKANTFKEIYRILKPNGIGKMAISDLVTSKEMDEHSVNADDWCSCIDGALTKENYLNSIREAGFTNIEVLDEKPYIEMENTADGSRKISSLVVKATKQ